MPLREMDNIFQLFEPDSDAEQKTLANLYSQGYLGNYRAEPLTQVKDERTPFGRMLQGVGILGEPAPREATPYEKYIALRGQQARDTEGLGMEGKKLQLGEAQRKRDVGALSDILGTADATGIVPQELMKYSPQAEDDVNALLQERRFDRAAKLKLEKLRMRLVQEQIRRGGRGGSSKDPYDVLGERVGRYLKLPGIKQLVEAHTELRQRIGRGNTDPDTTRKLQGQMSQMESQILAGGVLNGIPPEILQSILTGEIDITGAPGTSFGDLSAYQGSGDAERKIQTREDVSREVDRLLNKGQRPNQATSGGGGY